MTTTRTPRSRTPQAAAAKAAGLPAGTEPQRFRVLRPIRISNSHSIPAGEVIEVGKDWPYHRARQLTRQRYILPLAPGEGDEPETDDLHRMKRPQLLAIAAELGIEKPGALRKNEDLIAAIEEARASQNDESSDSDADDDEVSGSEMVTGNLDADELATWAREQLNDVAADLGIEDPASFEPDEALIAVMVTIPVEVPADDGGESE